MKTTNLGVCEWEALAFFEGDPVSRAYGTEWFDSDSAYEIERGGFVVSCAIHPIHRDVRLIIRRDEKIIFEWNAQGLSDICYVEEVHRTILKFISSEDDYTTLQVTPEITINRHSKEPDSEDAD